MGRRKDGHRGLKQGHCKQVSSLQTGVRLLQRPHRRTHPDSRVQLVHGRPSSNTSDDTSDIAACTEATPARELQVKVAFLLSMDYWAYIERQLAGVPPERQTGRDRLSVGFLRFSPGRLIGDCSAIVRWLPERCSAVARRLLGGCASVARRLLFRCPKPDFDRGMRFGRDRLSVGFL